VAALARQVPGVEQLVVMTGAAFSWEGADLFIPRSGYTGEDGFEISVPDTAAEALARALLAQPEVQPIGLGARNSLRLEAGLPLYGNDIDTTTTPVEAGLTWAMQKVRRTGGARAGGFAGADTVLGQLDGTEAIHKVRVGLKALERVPVREHTQLTDLAGEHLGEVTSGSTSGASGCEACGLQHREGVEDRCVGAGTHEPAGRPCVNGQRGDVRTGELDAARVRGQVAR